MAVPLVIHNVNAVTPYLTFGSLGSGPGQLNVPRGIAVDDSGNIYVADNRNHRVEEFDSSGKYVSEFDKGGIPEGIAIYNGTIYVVDRNTTSIEKFSPNGTLLSSFGSAGTNMGQLSNPERIAIDSSGNIYVADTGDIQKFNSKGVSISQFLADGKYQCCLNVMGVAVDSPGNVYAADMEFHKIIKFSPTGSTLAEFNATFSAPDISGTPQDVAVDNAGNIYVADTYDGRVVKLDPAGNPISVLAISGVPVGLAIKGNQVYVVDIANSRVDMFLTSQFVNNGTSITSSSTQRKEIPLNQNSTALDAAIKLATSSSQFQSLVKGYNYTFSSDFEESGPLSSGGIGVTAHGFAFEVYSGPAIPGKAVKEVEVMEDPSLAKILNVTSYPAMNYGGGAMSSASPQNPPPYSNVTNMLGGGEIVSPALQILPPANPLWNDLLVGQASSVSMSGDGQYVAIGTQNQKTEGHVYLYGNSGNLLWDYKTDRNIVTTAISKDGRYIAAGGYQLLDNGGPATGYGYNQWYANPAVYFMSNNGTLLWKYEPKGSLLWNIVMPSDGSSVITNLDGKIISFDRQGRLLWTYTSGNDVGSISVSSDGYHIVTNTADQVLYFDNTGKLLWSSKIDTDVNARSLISQDGKYVLASSSDPSAGQGKLYLFSNQGNLLWTKPIDGSLNTVTISDDDSKIAESSQSTEWLDLKGNVVFKSSSSTSHIKISPIGSYVIMVEDNIAGQANVLAYDKLGNNIWRFPVNDAETSQFATSSDGSYLAFATSVPNSGSSTIYYFNIQNITTTNIGTSSNLPVPEFPFAMLILLISFISLIVFYRMKFRK